MLYLFLILKGFRFVRVSFILFGYYPFSHQELIQKLSQCKPHGAAPLQTAPLAVVVLVDEKNNIDLVTNELVGSDYV